MPISPSRSVTANQSIFHDESFFEVRIYAHEENIRTGTQRTINSIEATGTNVLVRMMIRLESSPPKKTGPNTRKNMPRSAMTSMASAAITPWRRYLPIGPLSYGGA